MYLLAHKLDSRGTLASVQLNAGPLISSQVRPEEDPCELSSMLVSLLAHKLDPRGPLCQFSSPLRCLTEREG